MASSRRKYSDQFKAEEAVQLVLETKRDYPDFGVWGLMASVSGSEGL